jgi:hypothetical protein
MDVFAQPGVLVATCVASAVRAYAVREVASGALRAAGGDLWRWIKRRVSRST